MTFTYALYRSLLSANRMTKYSMMTRFRHSLFNFTSDRILKRPIFSGLFKGSPRTLQFSHHLLKEMTMKMDSLLNDPRRHFNYETLISKKKDGALLIIDVRQPEELVATGQIPDSINIPLPEVEDALAGITPEAFRVKYGVDKPSKGTLIVFSCQSGRRSVTALGKALFHGYLNAGNFKGGWLEWESHTRQQ